MAVTKVWIEEGCIVCNACETASPEVFLVTEDSCVIRAEVREDGQESENLEEKSSLKVNSERNWRTPLRKPLKAAQ